MIRFICVFAFVSLSACSGVSVYRTLLPDGTTHVSIISERADVFGVNVGAVSAYRCTDKHCEQVGGASASSPGVVSAIGSVSATGAALHITDPR